ncbi:phosphoadenylyl-sulfate reductase [Aquabacter cavernae]|uniref:phosphoadenylyl-sulfate reductase n=1 Tax=Aquabacter cavernae TaxID=2496029 RepID=UPI001FDF2B7E|nr:phosphoadenylyl-sulfate reductase [Aquabacter cavernae]
MRTIPAAMPEVPATADTAPPEAALQAARLAARLRDASPLEILSTAREAYGARIAAVSSFGTESAVLLHMIAQVDRSLPVLFLDTGHMFAETLAYRDTLVERLGLTDVRTLSPDPQARAARDPDDALWSEDPDACCALRKVEPLARAIAPFSAWINGRKRYQAETRAHIPAVEFEDGRVKFNPLAALGPAEIAGWMRAHDLPEHPLKAFGFASIGCMPCTSRVRPGEDPRAGRWRGRAKTECGIHVHKPGS